MDSLCRAAETRLGEQQMANHPCGLGPSLGVLLDPEQVNEPVEVRLEVRHRHAREPPEVPLEPGAEVVHHGHPLQVDRVVDVGPVRLLGAARLADQRAVRPLPVVDDQAPLGDMPAERPQHPRRAGLSAAAHHGDRVLVHVDGDRYADLLAGRPALPRHAVPKMQVGVVHVGLVYPDQVAQDDAVLVAVDGGHHAVAPLPCRLVGYAQLLGHGVEGHVEPHEADEAAPGRHVGFGPLKHRAGERGEPGPAGAAAPALDPSGGPPVPEGRGRAAGGAGGVGAVGVGGLGEGAEAVLLAAAPLVDGPAEELEVPLVERRDGVREGAVSVHLGVPVRSGAHPAGLSPNKSRVGSAANSRLAGTG